MKHLLFCLAALSAACAGCTSTSSTGITSSDITCDSSLTYANFGESFISTNCLSCHATKANPKLSTQALVQSNINRILQQAVYTNAMPEDADLATADRTKLGQWLQCGAP